jgi:uncharacterized membrane protein YidH (DUF202 family)
MTQEQVNLSPANAGAWHDGEEQLILGAAQLILAEKRTFLSLMRTGIAVFALPLATISALIATSKYYEPTEVLGLFIPVMLINAVLIALGAYLIVRAIHRIRHVDRQLADLKRSHRALAPYMD